MHFSSAVRVNDHETRPIGSAALRSPSLRPVDGGIETIPTANEAILADFAGSNTTLDAHVVTGEAELAQRQAPAPGPAISSFVREQRVTVLMTTFNRSHFIEEALDSLLAQSRPPDEVIVIDDGSTDDTRERVSRYGSKVRYLAKTNSGKSSCLNLGLSYAAGDWIWVFDDDDAALPHALGGMLTQLERHRDADFVYGGQMTGWSGADGRIVSGHTVLPPAIPAEDVFRSGLFAIPFLLTAALIRRRCIDAVGGFDERYPRGQDYEFMLRLLAHFPGVRWPEPVFVWRSHDGPRGPAHAGHHGALREHVWMEAAGRLGQELRQRLPLAAYLPGRASTDLLAPADLRCALLNRMSVMASKGLVNELLVDLHSAATLAYSSLPNRLDVGEAAACWAVGNFQFLRMRLAEAPDRFLSRLKQHADGRVGCAIVARIARGLLAASRHPERSRSERHLLRRSAWRLFAACGVRHTVGAYLPARSAAPNARG